MAEYADIVDGHQLRHQIHLDSVRWLGTVIAKSGGAKKIKKPSDLMKLPLIDKPDRNRLLEIKQFLESQKAAE